MVGFDFTIRFTGRMDMLPLGICQLGFANWDLPTCVYVGIKARFVQRCHRRQVGSACEAIAAGVARGTDRRRRAAGRARAGARTESAEVPQFLRRRPGHENIRFHLHVPIRINFFESIIEQQRSSYFLALH
jgi:hypothetical protein